MSSFIIEDILADFKPADDGHVHIYSLIDSEGVCIYVGQTVNLKRRIYEHLASGKEFSRVEETKCPTEKGNEAEAEAIIYMRPLLNKTLPKTDKYTTTAQLKITVSKLIDMHHQHLPIVFSSGTKKYMHVGLANDIVSHISKNLKAMTGGSDE